jgi:prepilin peptidase CpaA
MQTVYFPDPLVGWLYLVVLLGLLVIASYTDLRSFTIPKWISLTVLALGVVLNILRGVWLGAIEEQVYLLGSAGPVVGGLDGLLFALVGFMVGFLLFFGLWVVGVCGGGDVKLFAAVGAWVGPYLLVLLLIMSVVLVAIIQLSRLVWAVVNGKNVNVRKQFEKARAARRKGGAGLQPKHRALGFALPLALSCVIVLPWAFRFDLRLARVADPSRAAVDVSPPSTASLAE